MPFDADFDSAYEDLISPALEAAGYQVVRADEINTQQSVMKDIVNAIGASDLIVADLTESNPNVYYELGIAHGLKRDVILLTQEIGNLPFDLKSYRVVEYSLLLRDARRASTRLQSLAEEARRGLAQFGNPVSDFLVAASESRGTHDQQEIEKPLGIIDYQEKFEACSGQITSAISEVGDRTEAFGAVLREGTASLEDLRSRSSRPSPKQIRAALAPVTEEVDDYAKDLSRHNSTYEKLLPDLESSIDGLLHGQAIETVEQREELATALDSIERSIEAFQGGIDGTQTLKDAVDEMPNIEKNLYSANRKLSQELHRFTANIEQTRAIAQRAVELGRTRLEVSRTPSE